MLSLGNFNVSIVTNGNRCYFSGCNELVVESSANGNCLRNSGARIIMGENLLNIRKKELVSPGDAV